VEEALDEKAILERIRAHLRNGTPGSSPARTPGPAAVDASPEGIESDVASLRDTHDIYALPFRSERGALGPLLGLVNRILKKLLKPSLERQVSYNAANERLVRVVLVEMESLRRANAALNERCDALQAELRALRDAKLGG
jgi:hypothetical protein